MTGREGGYGRDQPGAARLKEMELEELRRKDIAHLIHPSTSIQEHARLGSEVIVGGEGIYVADARGRRYIDGYAGMGNCIVGYGRTEIVEAVSAQMKELSYYTSFFRFGNAPSIELAAKLATLTPTGLNRTYFCSGGSEAVETAFKIARMYQRVRGKEEKYKIISRRYAYHGLTLGALSAIGIPHYQKYFGPFVPGFVQIMAPYCYRCDLGLSYPSCGIACARQLEETILREGPDTVAAFIAEPVHGAGGHIVPPPEYLPMVREICDRHDVLFIADEVVTGFGRTGTMFGVEHWNVVPDIMTMAKGLSSGYLPLGATVVHDRIYDALLDAPEEVIFSHGLTYSSHPACCAAGLKNIEIIEREGLVERSRVLGAYLVGQLQTLADRWSIVGNVRGLGLLAGVELVQDQASRRRFPPEAHIARRVIEKAFEGGLICRAAEDTLTLRPPLIISRAEIDDLVGILDRAIGGVEASVEGGG